MTNIILCTFYIISSPDIISGFYVSVMYMIFIYKPNYHCCNSVTPVKIYVYDVTILFKPRAIHLFLTYGYNVLDQSDQNITGITCQYRHVLITDNSPR